MILNDTKHLIQSLELSHARYEYLKSKEIGIDIYNYSKLFYNKKIFEKLFGIDNDKLLELYPVEEYLKVQKLYERLEILHKLNPIAANELVREEIQKYIDDNNSIEKRINNNYEKVISKTMRSKLRSNK